MDGRNLDASPPAGAARRPRHRLLLHPRLPLILAVLVVVLALPSLMVGCASDDYIHRLTFLGSSPVPASLHLHM